MRNLWKLPIVALCLAVGAPRPAVKTVASKASPPAVAKSVDASVAPAITADKRLPQELKCREVETRGGDKPWADARVIPGLKVASAASVGQQRVILFDAKLSGQNLSDLPLSNICFEQSDLRRTDWRRAVATGVAVKDSDLRDALMSGAALERAMFLDSNLSGVDASGAKLVNAGIVDGSYDHLKLRAARMRGFVFLCFVGSECADESPTVDVRDADLTKAQLVIPTIEGWTLDDAVVANIVIDFTQVRELRKARINGPVVVFGGLGASTRVRLTATELRQLWTLDGADSACDAAKSLMERLICDPQVRHRDREMTLLYRDAVRHGTTTVASQRRWLAERDRCALASGEKAQTDCLESAYIERNQMLAARLPKCPSLGRRNEYLYISQDLVPPRSFMASALYAKIFPVLVATADENLLVRRSGAGRIRVRARGHAYNGHSCSIENVVLDFDPATGSFGARHSAWWGKVDGESGREDVVEFTGDIAEIQTRSGEFAACGVRASWGQMARVPVPRSQRRWLSEYARRWF